jgi:hypothetical protein
LLFLALAVWITLTGAIAVTNAAISSILKAVIQVDCATRSGFATALRFDCQGLFSQLKLGTEIGPQDPPPTACKQKAVMPSILVSWPRKAQAF